MPPRSQYGVLHHFTKKFYEALVRAGISCRLLEAQYDNPKPFLDKIFSDPPECTLSFNGLLPDEQGRFFCDMIKIPHIACLVDSPNHFFSLVKSPYSIITCVDRFSCDFFRGMNFQNVLFMPHAVEKDLAQGLDEDRVYDVVMLSSCIDYEGIRKSWKKMFPAPLCNVMDEAIEAYFADEETSYVQAFVLAMDKYQRQHSDIDPQKLDFIAVFDQLETYIKGKDRVDLVKSVKDAKVHVFGSSSGAASWKKYLGKSHPNVVIRDPVPFEQALQIMQQSKIVLNSCSWIKNGAHERIFASLLSGALVITVENIYMREHFQDGKNIVFYRYREMDQVNEKVNEYLAEEKKRKSLVAKGRETVLKGHTWDHRAAALIKELDPIMKRMPSK